MNRKRLKELAEALTPALSGERFSWNERRRSLRKKMLKNNPEKFMQWPVVQEFLYSGMVPHIQDELDDLMLDNCNWDFRWQEAIAVPPFGGGKRNVYDASGTSIQQVYYLMLWESFSGREIGSVVSIREFGGGYGSMALACKRLGYTGDYAIYDLPEVSLLQQYYLSNVGVDNVMFNNGVDNPELFIAMFSLSEIDMELREIPDAESYLMGYQGRWSEYDNKGFFSEFAKSKPELDWLDIPNPYFGNHRYLIGV